MTSKDNSMEWLDEILSRMAVDLAVKDEPMFEAEKRAKQAIRSHLLADVMRARIEELENFLEYRVVSHNLGLEKARSVSVKKIEERLAQLQKEGE